MVMSRSIVLDGNELPYVDNLVNLLVTEDLGDVPMDEVLRVLVPNGVAMIKDGNGQWNKTVKPRPTNIDEWSHYLHDATGNSVAHDDVVAPPRHLQWVGSPRWSRHHDRMASMSALVSTGGRMFYIMDEGSRISIQLPPKWKLIARDAFNGTRSVEARHSRMATSSVAAQERSDATVATSGFDRRYRLRDARIRRTADGTGCGDGRRRCGPTKGATRPKKSFTPNGSAVPGRSQRQGGTRRLRAAARDGRRSGPQPRTFSGTKSRAC